MNNLDILKNKQGSTAILMSILVLTTILVISISTNTVVNKGLEMGKTQVFSVKAFYASEAGTESILWQVRKNNLSTATTSANAFLCLDGSGMVVSSSMASSTCESGANHYNYTLSNDATYFLKHDMYYDNGYNATTTIITSYGDYKDNRRLTQIEY